MRDNTALIACQDIYEYATRTENRTLLVEYRQSNLQTMCMGRWMKKDVYI
jgi:hypothetical protein